MLMQQVYDEKFESKILFLLFYNFLKHSFLSILQDISKNEIGDRFTQNDFNRLENFHENNCPNENFGVRLCEYFVKYTLFMNICERTKIAEWKIRNWEPLLAVPRVGISIL